MTLIAHDAAYLARPEFQPHAGPRGSLHSLTIEHSAIFPGFRHWCGVYVPHPAFAKTPSGLMVLMDGSKYAKPDGDWRTTCVLDNLIAAGDIPPLVCVFVSQGLHPDAELKREQRSIEYDTLSTAYSEFLLREVLPLAARYADWSDDPDLHGIGGWSSGAICGFTVAWHRPDAFRKIYSANGSFTNIRGGGAYPSIVAAGPDRPLRVYLWAAEYDMSRPDWGDWLVANKAMAEALKTAGYDMRFDIGEGNHDQRYAAARFPDALRWLWRK